MKKFHLKLSICLIFLIIIIFISLILGAAKTSIQDIFNALFTNQKNDQILILQEIRIPRIIGAILVGSALAVSGSIMQGVTRNPLAEPGLLGLTAGANLGVVLATILLPKTNYFSILIISFLGALLATLLVISINSIKKCGFEPIYIILTGSAITTFLSAISEGIAIYFKISKQVSMWTSGGLIGTSWKELSVIIPFILVGIILALILARQLTVLSLSEEIAIGLGQKTTILKLGLFIVVILLTASSVALLGNIIFVGLMIPHLARSIVGHDYKHIIPVSIILGASFMLLTDLLARTIASPYEVPLIAVTSLIGLPFFLIIIQKVGKTSYD